MKRILEAVGWLTAVALLAFASHAVFASTASAREPEAARSSVSRQQEPRRDAPPTDERRGRERKVVPREDLSPVSIVREARTIYVRPTRHLDKK